jgi:hypothetical protein
VEPGDSGDGTVPDWSAKLPRAQSLAVGGEHGTLYKNGDVRKNLAVLLGVDRRLRAAEVWPPMELALRGHVVEPGGRVRGVLSFPASGRLLGELRLERARDPGGGAPPELTPVPGTEPIDYSGPTTDSLGIVLSAPRSRGAYRVSFYPAREDEPAASDELFVVDP